LVEEKLILLLFLHFSETSDVARNIMLADYQVSW